MRRPLKLFLLQNTILRVTSSPGVINSTTRWTAIEGINIYKILSQCERTCVLNSHNNTNPWCDSYGCVCSENDPYGRNYQDARSSVLSCAKSCPNSNNGNTATRAFQDLCVIYTESVSSRILIVTDDYQNLTACGKYVLNGCRKVNGTLDDTNCGPEGNSAGWKEYGYRGVATERRCGSVNCLCESPSFNDTLGVASSAIGTYCGLFIDSNGIFDKEWKAVINVAANFCSNLKFPPHDWYFKVVGEDPKSIPKKPILSQESAIAVGLGVPSFLVGLGAFMLAYLAYRRQCHKTEQELEELRLLMLQLRVEHHESPSQNQPQQQIVEMPPQPPAVSPVQNLGTEQSESSKTS